MLPLRPPTNNTKPKTDYRYSVLKVAKTITKLRTKSVYEVAATISATVTDDLVETITTSSVATTETISPTETVTISVTATETAAPATTIYSLHSKLQSLVNKSVPPASTTAMTIVERRYSVSKPRPLRQYDDSSIKTACRDIVKNPYKTKYTTKTRTVYRVSTKVRTEVHTKYQTNTITRSNCLACHQQSYRHGSGHNASSNGVYEKI